MRCSTKRKSSMSGPSRALVVAQGAAGNTESIIKAGRIRKSISYCFPTSGVSCCTSQLVLACKNHFSYCQDPYSLEHPIVDIPILKPLLSTMAIKASNSHPLFQFRALQLSSLQSAEETFFLYVSWTPTVVPLSSTNFFVSWHEKRDPLLQAAALRAPLGRRRRLRSQLSTRV